MTFKEELITQIANATVINKGIDKNQHYLDGASESIVLLAEAIIKRLEDSDKE